MITVPSAVEQILKKRPFIEEAFSQELINLSSLARLILPEVRELTFKEVKEGAILMALKRLPKTLRSASRIKDVLGKSHDLIARSNLAEFTVLNSDFSIEKHKKIIKEAEETKKYFLTITQGVFETTIIISKELKERIEEILGKGKVISQFDNLSSITIRLPGKTVLTPGVYYTILKYLAWEGINVVEVVSTFSEFTVILENKEVGHAFSLLKSTLS
ncbi:aspartate kinase [Candidatus Shapirobacteria bacterium CG03_land_8_20_14_0_80_39_12]|uniref:Aspartate kinase n=1 Tax=Candidatus Shapirobacteria bacterium CG03_land_8_20_14_0_80_39_12 TaxID=1974879 RepID=A0A2M7BF90_9BACT|nr:MAG: aspartate kinase [Candidatus Shapirobacteria bacterium CG03_land_8_20_14_0_80_39_12]